MFGWLFNGLISLITYPFFTLGWYFLVYLPLSVIAFFNFIFDQIGINVIVNALFQKKSFSFENLPVGFWIFAITSISMGFIVFILRYIKFLIIRKRSADSEIIAMGKVGFGSFAFIFLFPIIFFVLLVTIQSTLFLINDYIRGEQNLIIVMLRSASNKIPEDEINSISESFSSPSYSTFSAMESGEAISLIITLSASSIIVAYILGISFISWFTASAQLFMNFLTMPVWAISSIWDDGRRLKSWTKNFLGQFAIIIVYQVSFNLFLIWIGSTYKIADLIDLDQVKSPQIFRFLFRISFIIGGGLAIASFTRQIAAQFGQAGALEHQQRLASSVLKVGAVAATGAAGIMALGQNFKSDKLNVSSLLEKNKNKNPFNVTDNSFFPGSSKLNSWRLPAIAETTAAAWPILDWGYKGLKHATQKFKEKRAKKALIIDTKKSPARLFFDKIGGFFKKNKKQANSDGASVELLKLDNKQKANSENSNKPPLLLPYKNLSENKENVEDKLQKNPQKNTDMVTNTHKSGNIIEKVDDNNGKNSEKNTEKSLVTESETQNLAKKANKPTEIVETQEEKPEKKGFWEWFWGKLPEETKKSETTAKTVKKVTKKAKKSEIKTAEKSTKTSKKIKTVEPKEKKTSQRKKKTSENQVAQVKENDKSRVQENELKLNVHSKNLNLKKIEDNHENIKPIAKKTINSKKQIEP
ncbi:Mbov_0396 family ICE element transmembrane protein [Mesomycoplasma flocculare]|uniref:Uncharacterized protein n=1 Tax=Mesomycoplasma flocculare TaxID=2128 RepID=A0AAW9XGU3_MESFC|nr:hypothetical protein [Mesomycoplasma flocculare]MXR39535.1 hypothetical protein [Mycoplasma sp. MF12]MXR05989.1 hypothetical protein [Mesomycoplasma flocculare]MXR12356.1 hypothetical protein [Mesomycoplasma flocculare]MXR22979.1 hypothetical protein [Mesomycoplasma flocculare]MXR56812.1 hypothetical protein [Mesomycoplasma flocculare]